MQTGYLQAVRLSCQFDCESWKTTFTVRIASNVKFPFLREREASGEKRAYSSKVNQMAHVSNLLSVPSAQSSNHAQTSFTGGVTVLWGQSISWNMWQVLTKPEHLFSTPMLQQKMLNISSKIRGATLLPAYVQ